MAKGRWKRRVTWTLGILLVLAIVLAVTWRAWTPAALRIALKTQGVQVKSIAWEGTNSWKFEGVERSDGGVLVRAASITMLTPNAWREALKAGRTNDVFMTVNGWRIARVGNRKKTRGASSTNSIADGIRKLNESVRTVQAQCPHAVFLNGTIQSDRREFNFAAVEWKGGELSGDLTWPMLNDPAEFKMKVINTNKLQIFLKQIALEIGARAVAETLPDGARLAGYARWTTNRADFDLVFPREGNAPRSGILDSKGIAIPGRFIGLPEIDRLNARMRLVIKNGQFEFRLSPPIATQ